MERLNIYDFIEYTKQNKLKFINYCEILLDPYGKVIICNPSHTETAIKYAMYKENKTRNEIMESIPKLCLPLEWYVDMYGLVAIWYCGYMYSSYKRTPNRFQKKSIKLLLDNGLIREDYCKPAYEYKLYLQRKEMGLEED